MNLQDFYNGKAFDAYEFFGAHKEDNGVVFRTYAPNAKKVFVAGEFNDWKLEEMMQQHKKGIYSFSIADAKAGQMYKYAVKTGRGKLVYHSDPYSFGMQLRPDTASYIVDLSEYKFRDSKWLETRDKNFNRPLNIYEMHLGSWLRNSENENVWYRYNEIADWLIAYVKKNKYTHIEFLPLSEHPSDCSWGYQITGFYSPTSRYGTAKDLMELIDKCHQAEIGVIMDFVPVHFAVDDYGLKKFDGSALYEHPHKDAGASEWGTCNFNHSRGEVRSFLQSCANFWLKEFHFDGLRMDAISRAIYRQGDPATGVNDDGVKFLKYMNSGLSRIHPTAMLIAEDSTSFPKVTFPVAKGGLGFDYKWDLGWMNDTLNYFMQPPENRPDHYNKLTFSMHYFFNERYLLPFSHDEVVHCKGSLFEKMWGVKKMKWRQLRALYMYMYTHPGKKLSFMGNELAQQREWNEATELDWDLLKKPRHRSFHEYVRKLNDIYFKYPALHDSEYDETGFTWIEANAAQKSIYAYERGSQGQRVIGVFNFSDKAYRKHPFLLAMPATLTLILRSDDDMNVKTTRYSDQVSETVHDTINNAHMVKIDLPAFCGKLFVCGYNNKPPAK